MMNFTLTNLKDVNLKLRDLAINTVKYQKFKTSVAIQKFEYDFKKQTAMNYFNLGVVYINTKVKSRSVGKKFYDYIDDAINQHVQPLTPTEDDKRIIKQKKTYTKRNLILPVQETLKSMQQQSLTEKFEYGVMYDDTIKVFGTDENKAKIFLEGIKFAGGKGRLVSIQDIKE